MSEDLTIREKKVLNKFDYPKSVIKQAEEENTQISIHAMNIFNEIVFSKIKVHSKDEFLIQPWKEDFKMFDNNEDLNHTVSMCFELAENFRTGCDIDLQARLEQLTNKLHAGAPHIIKPGANVGMVKDNTLRGEVPGLHDQ